MKVSRDWLQHFFDAPLPESGALSDALTFHVFEIDGVEHAGDDVVLDVKVTPNRGHDCLSHRGIAKELSAILPLPLAHDPLAQAPDFSAYAGNAPSVRVSINTPMCARYVACHIRGVKVGPSPAWLKRNLEAIGQRSVNNVVDATNFVMFNTGQPLHAFDAGKLTEKDGAYAVEVRPARAGEKMLALDNKEYEFTEQMMVIADANKGEAIGIAGIKGGMPAGITEATIDIILESANFDGVSVRKTAAALKLRTDASSRFEQVISPEFAGYGMQSVIELIVRIAGGEVASVVDEYQTRTEERRVEVSLDKINSVLGTSLTAADVSSVFSRLQFSYKEREGVFEVEVPFERLDISIAEDLIEEVVRIQGYDSIAAVLLPETSAAPAVNPNFYAAEKAREELVSQGYSEVYTSVFADAGERAVLNKVDSVRPHLRATLLDGLNDALKKNIPNKDLLGLKEVKLFEIGMVWKGNREQMMLGTVTEKQKASEKPLAPEMSPSYAEAPLSSAVRYQQFSKYPYIVRDIACWTPAGTEESGVRALIAGEAGDLAQKISLFDRFEKNGRVSFAFRIIFQSFERTLTEAEANSAMEKISSALKERGFEIR